MCVCLCVCVCVCVCVCARARVHCSDMNRKHNYLNGYLLKKILGNFTYTSRLPSAVK